jgi:hypothetical protein
MLKKKRLRTTQNLPIQPVLTHLANIQILCVRKHLSSRPLRARRWIQVLRVPVCRPNSLIVARIG